MRNFKVYIFALLVLILTIGCNPVETNLRTIYEDYVYVSSDSTLYDVEFRNPTWVSKNIYKWTSAGMLFTNIENVITNDETRIPIDTIIENGFNGILAINFHPFVVPSIWETYPIGSFQKKYYDATSLIFLKTTVDDVVEYDGYKFVDPLLSISETETLDDQLEQLQNIYISHISEFVTDYSDSNITIFNHIPWYSTNSYPLYDMTDTFDSTTDPLDQGKTYDQYLGPEKVGFHTTIDEWITRFHDTQLNAFRLDPQIKIIVSAPSGGRLRSDTSLVASDDISGWFISNITNQNKDSWLQFFSDIREAYQGGSASTLDKNFLFCAGFTESTIDIGDNEYVESILFAVEMGMYFTPGFGSTYFDQTEVDQWWKRGENNDSNWQHNQFTPEYMSINELPFNNSDGVVLSVETTITNSTYIYDENGDPKIELDVEIQLNKPAPVKMLVREDGGEYPDDNSIQFMNDNVDFYSFKDTTSILPPIIPPQQAPPINLSWTSGGGDIGNYRMERLPTNGSWSIISNSIPYDAITFTDETTIIDEVDYKITAIGLYGGESNVAQLTSPFLHYTKRLYVKTIAQDTTSVLVPPAMHNPVVDPDAPEYEGGGSRDWNEGLYVSLPIHVSDEIDYLHKQQYINIITPTPSNLVASINPADSTIIDVSLLSDVESLAWIQWKIGATGTWSPLVEQWYSDPNHDSTYRLALSDTISTLSTIEKLTAGKVSVRVKVKSELGLTSDWLERTFLFERRNTAVLLGTFVFSNNSTAPLGTYDHTITVDAFAGAIDFNTETSSTVEWGNYNIGPPPLGSYYERYNPGGLHFTPPASTLRNYPLLNLGTVSDVSDLVGGIVLSATLWIKFADEPLTNMDQLFIWSCAGEDELSDVLEEWLEHGYDNISHKLSDHIGNVHWTIPIAVNEGDPDPRDLNWPEDPIYPENPMFGKYVSFIVADLNTAEQGWIGFDVTILVQDQLDRDKPFTYYLSFTSTVKNGIATFYNGIDANTANRFYLEAETE